jgi:hypothetical protein
MPKKPKALSQKRSLDFDSEGGPSNANKQARAFGGSDPFLDKRELHIASARTRVPPHLTSVALPKQHGDDPLERAVLESDIPATRQGPRSTLESATEPVLKPPPPPQQVGKKWGSFIDNEDVW